MGPVRRDAVVEKGLEIFRLMEAEPPAVFNKKFWAGKMMEAAMDHPELKVALFRFIDVLPTLSGTQQLSRHIKEYFLSGGSQYTGITKSLLSGATSGLTAGIAASLVKKSAGLPDGVLNFIPGRGSVVGDHLVEHPATDFILFTGSMEVGLGIVEKAGKTKPGQKGPKKVVIETGGKNAIIVDGDADLDQAVPGVIQSAFGFQGQKCSACSRAIVLEDCYDRFLERLTEAVKGITIGNPEDPKNFMGPVVDAAARKTITGYIEAGKMDGKVLVQVPVPDTGYFVPPTVFVDLPSDSKVLREEIFGPVLSVVKVKDIDEALEVANSSIYALTGGLFSRSPANIEKVAREFSTGNLYINRGCTGAIVGRQPFGGFRMSGVGSKSGGPEYLQQFMEPRVVTENTMRRGFIPEDVL